MPTYQRYEGPLLIDIPAWNYAEADDDKKKWASLLEDINKPGQIHDGPFGDLVWLHKVLYFEVLSAKISVISSGDGQASHSGAAPPNAERSPQYPHIEESAAYWLRKLFKACREKGSRKSHQAMKHINCRLERLLLGDQRYVEAGSAIKDLHENFSIERFNAQAEKWGDTRVKEWYSKSGWGNQVMVRSDSDYGCELLDRASQFQHNPVRQLQFLYGVYHYLYDYNLEVIKLHRVGNGKYETPMHATRLGRLTKKI